MRSEPTGAAPDFRPTRRRTLTTRLTGWIAVTVAASLVAFALIVYAVVLIEEEKEDHSGEVHESIAETIADVREEVALAFAVAAPVGLLLSVGGAFWLARRTIAPVGAAVEAATGITAERLDRRLPVPEADDELRDLAVALNALLARLEQGFSAQARFTADASHELRTPLAVIASELEVALRRPRAADEWERAARTVLDEVRHLGRLVDALLALSRAEATHPGPASRADLGAVLDEVIARASAAAAAAGVSLAAAAVPADVVVCGDADALASAIGNVVANAIRATPPGGAVTVHAVEAGDAVSVHVDDTGPGIAAGSEERIFEPFSRGDSDGDGDGLGLGLAIARGIAAHSDGALRAGRAPGGGARFTFTLRPVAQP